MTYDAPQIHEVGIAEEVILGPIGIGCDLGELFPPECTLEDFYE